MKWILRVFILEISFLLIDGQCNWPTSFQNSIWQDSDKGALTFTTTTMSGWEFSTTAGDLFETWDCFLRADYTASSGHTILILKSTLTFTMFGTVYKPFVCMQLTEVTANSFYYYMLGVEEVRVNYERLSVRILSEAEALTQTDAEANLCVTGNTTVNEYHVLVKDASETDATQDCPAVFQDAFWYYVNVSGTITCNTQTELWDACTDTKTMTFNYTQCSTPVAYSNTGSVRCMVSLTSGSNTLVTVWNSDGTVNPPSTYRFTCFLATADGSGSLAVSQSPKSCTKGQTPHDQPVHPDGTTGLNLVLTPHTSSSCDPTTTTTTTPATTTTTTVTTTTTAAPTTTTTEVPTTTTTTEVPTTTTTTEVPTTTTTTEALTTTTTTEAPTTTTTTEVPTTTTTTEATTTTTVPTTTTTNPPTTTTTTSPATTTTTALPTTTTTAAITTQAPTTAAPEASNNNTIALIAAIAGGVAIVLVLSLIIGLMCYKRCRKKQPVISVKPPPTPEPDLILESMPHKTAGYGGITPNLFMGPRETTFENSRPQTGFYVFTNAKTNNFAVTMPPPVFSGTNKTPRTNRPSFLQQRSSTNLTTSLVSPKFNTISEADTNVMYSGRSYVDTELTQTSELSGTNQTPRIGRPSFLQQRSSSNLTRSTSLQSPKFKTISETETAVMSNGRSSADMELTQASESSGTNKTPRTDGPLFQHQKSSINLTRSTSLQSPKVNTISENEATVEKGGRGSANSRKHSLPENIRDVNSPVFDRENHTNELIGQGTAMSPIPVESPEVVSKSFVPENTKPILITPTQEQLLNSRVRNTPVSPKTPGTTTYMEDEAQDTGRTNGAEEAQGNGETADAEFYNVTPVNTGSDSQQLFTTFKISPTKASRQGQDLVITNTPDSVFNSSRLSEYTKESELDVSLPSDTFPKASTPVYTVDNIQKVENAETSPSDDIEEHISEGEKCKEIPESQFSDDRVQDVELM